MQDGAYVLVLYESDNSYCYQPHFESLLFNNSTIGMQPVSISDKPYCSYAQDHFIEISNKNIKNKLLEKIPFITRDGRNVKLIKSELNYGEKYHCMYRPMFSPIYRELFDISKDVIPACYYQDPPIECVENYNSYIRQLDLIVDELSAIFKVVHPSKNNFKTYGNAIRNVIILACTEIDTIMKSIMKSNGVYRKNDVFKTTDYVRLMAPMQLRKYSLQIKYMEEIGTFAPFKNWKAGKSSQSIPWYDAYNKVKHDRESNFYLATLSNAINSVIALAITLIARYGYRNDIWNERMGKIFNVVTEPLWRIKDFYLPSFELNNTVFVKHPDIQDKTN